MNRSLEITDLGCFICTWPGFSNGQTGRPEPKLQSSAGVSGRTEILG